MPGSISDSKTPAKDIPDMKPTIHEAVTPQQRHDVYRFRYDIYVEEMGRYRSVADHDQRIFSEPEDETARLYYATDGEQIVATMRHNWGGDAPLCARQIEQYDLARFLKSISCEQMIVGERFMIAPSQRGTDLIFRLFQTYLNFVNEHRIQLIFGDCEPHLLNLYLGMGFRTYAERNVNSKETGYLVPLVMVPEDIAYMKQVKSPFVTLLQDYGDAAKVPGCLPELLSCGRMVVSHALTPQNEYQSEIDQAIQLAENPTHLFDGLTENECQRCLSKSNAIECMAGDHLIKAGNVAQNMFAVLSGTLEVRSDDRVVDVCCSGDIVGEMAFLLESPRAADVYVATDGTRVLSLSESNLKKLAVNEPQLAAKLLLNLSKLLCYKLLRAGQVGTLSQPRLSE